MHPHLKFRRLYIPNLILFIFTVSISILVFTNSALAQNRNYLKPNYNRQINRTRNPYSEYHDETVIRKNKSSRETTLPRNTNIDPNSENYINEDDFLPRPARFQRINDHLESDSSVEASPKNAWDDIPPRRAKKSNSTLKTILLWIPNRVLDFIDIFKLDVGVGPAVGATVRVTKYAEAGTRLMLPASLRVGAMGRRLPVALETESEFGIDPFYSNSRLREPCVGEVGGGLDLAVIGLYGGICVDEVADFFLGIFTIDINNDDL